MHQIRRVAWCPHCGNRTPQRLVCMHRSHVVEEYDGSHADHFDIKYFIAVCDTCDDLLLYLAVDEDIPEDSHFEEGRLVWPVIHELPDYVPKSIRQCYAEALQIRSRSPSGFAVLIRKALDLLCDDRGAPRGSLLRRLTYLVQNGELPRLLAETTNVLRILGNVGAHARDTQVVRERLHLIDQFFLAVMEYVYITPVRLKHIHTAISKLENE